VSLDQNGRHEDDHASKWSKTYDTQSACRCFSPENHKIKRNHTKRDKRIDPNSVKPRSGWLLRKSRIRVYFNWARCRGDLIHAAVTLDRGNRQTG